MTTPVPQQPSTVPGHRYPLPCGGWVSFLDPEDITGREHRKVIANLRPRLSSTDLDNVDRPKELMAAMAESGQAMAMGMDFHYGMTCMLVDEWYVPYAPRGTNYTAGALPLPSDDTKVLESLRYRDYRAVLDLAAPLIALIENVAGGTVTPDDAGVPGTPTPPAGG